MSKTDSLNKALVAVLFEIESQQGNMDRIIEIAHAGLMGAKLYAPASAEAKPDAVAALREAIAEARYYLDIQNT